MPGDGIVRSTCWRCLRRRKWRRDGGVITRMIVCSTRKGGGLITAPISCSSRLCNDQDDCVQHEEGRRFDHCSDQLQQQALQCSKRSPWKSSSDMQAVFLQGSHPPSRLTKGSVGTGVFLSSGTGNVKEPTKKSGCSAVLLPAGVIQALKLHFDRVDQQSLSNANAKPCSCRRRIPMRQDVMNNNRDGYDNAKQRRRFLIAAALWSQDSNSGEGLPHEWSY